MEPNTTSMSTEAASSQAKLQCCHLLKLHFPATELLPEGQVPYLQPPVDVGYREEPKLGTYHLTSSNLEYFTAFTTGAPNSVTAIPGTDTDISVSVSRLAEAPGLSDLGAVAYIGNDDIITVFCLRTTWITPKGIVREVERTFELGSPEWQLHLMYADSNPHGTWLKLMNDLMTGGTDRAVLHRRQKLDAYDLDFADETESHWPFAWKDMPLKSPNELLAAHIEDRYDEDEGGEVYTPSIHLSWYADSWVVNGRLPCGHPINFLVGTLKQLSEEQCLRASCEDEDCWQKIMTKRDRQHLALVAERQRRAEWALEQIDWERLDTEIDQRPSSKVVAGPELYRSYGLSLDSMQVPESASPASLDHSQASIVMAMRRHFEKILCSQAAEITMSPSAVFEEMVKQATVAIKDASAIVNDEILALVLPPGFNEFLFKLLTRTVNHAFGISARNDNTDGAVDISTLTEDLRIVDLDRKETKGNTGTIAEY